MAAASLIDPKALYLMRRGLSYFTRYPEAERYRLIVDGKMHAKEQGWVGYEEREPGCIQAMFTGFAHTVQNLDQQLSLDLICALHRHCTTRVDFKYLESDLRFKASRPGELRTEPRHITGFPLQREITTPEGLAEMWDKVHDKKYPRLKPEPGTVDDSRRKDWERDFGASTGPMLYPQEYTPLLGAGKSINVINQYNHRVDCYHPEGADKEYPSKQVFIEKTNRLLNSKSTGTNGEVSSYQIFYQAPRAQHVSEEINTLITSYNSKIVSARNDDEKLAVMVDHIWEFEHLHPFTDANTRTFIILLLNWMLMQNGFPPATFEDPNRFDGYSKREMVIEVKRAIKNSLRLIHGEEMLFGFRSSAIAQDKQALYRTKLQVSELNAKLIEKKQYLDGKLAAISDLPIVTELVKYAALRKEEPETLTFWGTLSGMSRAIKVAAAEKFIDNIRGNTDIVFSDQEVEALREGRLGRLVAKYEKSHALPLEFKRAENTRMLRNVRIYS